MICTPGPGTMLTIDAAFGPGLRVAARVLTGVVLGQAIWVLAAAGGVATVLAASDGLAYTLRNAGATFLIFLGLRGAWTAVRDAPRVDVAEPTPGAALRIGLVSNMLNPKMLIIAGSLLPSAALGRPDPAVSTLLLGLLMLAITTAWLGTWVLLASRLRGWVPARLISGLAGVALTLLGIRLLIGVGL
jgi:threonine/homoserine/homoserine lactone efflux protein